MLRAVTSVCGLLLIAIGCVPTEPADHPNFWFPLECGQPLPETCGSRTRTYAKLPSRVGDPPIEEIPLSGEMTEEAAQAKRLFDKALWPEALVALEAVAKGAHGDDEGNRQIAEHHVAIVNYNMKDYDAASDLFLLIMEHPSHLESYEATLWIAKLTFYACSSARILRAFASLGYDSQAGSCDPEYIPEDLRPQYAFFRARGLVERGELHEAARLFKGLRSNVCYGFRSRQCLEWIGEQDP